MLCQFHDGICVNCGCRRDPPYPRRRCTPGLGDRIAKRLASVGITKDRAQAVAEMAGFADCGCHQRQETLNEWGRQYLGIGVATPSGPLDP